MATRYLWQPKEPVSAVIEKATNSSNKDLMARITDDISNFKQMLNWLLAAYSRKEVISIMIDCGFERNIIVSYGFSQDEVIAVINEKNPDYGTNDQF